MSRRGIIKFIIIGVIALAAAAASVGVWLHISLNVATGRGGATRFTLRSGASVREVAAELKAVGLIRSARAFRLAAWWQDGWRQAAAGDYALRRDMTAMEMLRAFQRGDVITEWITVPEGLALWQVAELVEAEGLGSGEGFLRIAYAPDDFEAGFPLPADSLEGYLFPDTYKIARHPGAERELARVMLMRFEQVVWQDLLGGRPPNSTLHEVVILASLVEGEGKLDAERPTIAGVLTNRLRQGRKLECDATVQYALGPDRKQRLTYDDLTTPSPYNTYVHPGLPPGPINSPGRASIEAALHPAETAYLYYVARPDGSHIFSRTYAGHLRAIARARGERRAQGTR